MVSIEAAIDLDLVHFITVLLKKQYRLFETCDDRCLLLMVIEADFIVILSVCRDCSSSHSQLM